MSIKIEGTNSLISKLEDINKAQALENAMGKACALVENSAKRKAPKDTGALRRSIESKVESNGKDVQGLVFTPLEYAPYIEYGTGLFAEKGGRTEVPWFYVDDEGKGHLTKGIHPHPYMRPALNENIKKIKDILLKEGLLND